jgi:hypothetical protein
MAWRLRPLIFLAASYPLGPPASAVLTLWLSITAAEGAGLAAGPLAIAHDEVVVDGLEQAVPAKPQKPAIDRRHRREILRQQTPGAACLLG